jgi:hypothetical protein
VIDRLGRRLRMTVELETDAVGEKLSVQLSKRTVGRLAPPSGEVQQIVGINPQ